MEKEELNFVIFAGERAIKNVYKHYLRQAEDLLEEGHINENHFDYLRNRILDLGNEEMRNFRDALEQYHELVIIGKITN